MRALAEDLRINMGLAAADRDEMVYLESFRYNRRIALRQVVSGLRVPMELTSLGHAYLSSIPDPKRKALLAEFKQRRPRQWRVIGAQIEAARQSIQEDGVCAASWQPEVVAIATPLPTAEATYALNVSVSSTQSVETLLGQLASPLLELRRKIEIVLMR